MRPAPDRRARILASLVLLALGGVLGVVALRGPLTEPAASEGSITGVLLSVQSSSPVDAERVTLRDDEGQVWTFRVSREVAANPEEPQSAGHLRQHMALVEPVLIRYREEPDGLVAVRILDAQ